MCTDDEKHLKSKTIRTTQVLCKIQLHGIKPRNGNTKGSITNSVTVTKEAINNQDNK